MAAVGPAGAPAPPKITFAERLAAAGYDRIPAAARPTQTMVDTIVNLRASKKRACPCVFSKLEPWIDRSWSQTSGHKGAAHAIHEQACLETVGAEPAAATGGTFDPSGAVAAAALSTATRMAASYDPAGIWWAATQRVAHLLAIAGAFGPQGIAMATAYLAVLGLVAARHGMDFVKSYDAELRLLVASSSEYTEERVAALFSDVDHSVLHTLQSRPRPTQTQAPQRSSSSAPAHGGGGGSGGNRACGSAKSRYRKRSRVPSDGAPQERSSPSSRPPIIPSGHSHSGKGGGGRGGGGGRKPSGGAPGGWGGGRETYGWGHRG